MLAALLLVLAAHQEEPAPVAFEWWVRAAAAAPAAHAAQLAEALAAPEWRARARALDALQRAAGNGTVLPEALLAAARRALVDVHPSVRTRAVAVLGAARAELAAESAARLASEPFANLRHELARALEFAPSPGRAGLLARLARDPDARVRAAAQNALCGLSGAEPGVGAARLERLAAAAAEGAEALAHFLGQLVLAAPDEHWLAEARVVLARFETPRRALLEALSFAATGRGDAELLVAGARAEESWEPAQARLFAQVAPAPDLAQACLATLEESTLGPRARRGLQALLFDVLEPHTLAFLARAPVSPARLAELLGELGLRRDAWEEPECAALAAPTAPLEVRRALLGAVADGFTRSPQASSEALLLVFLTDPEPALSARAYEVLCETRSPSRAAEAALHAAWTRLDERARSARVAWFSREHPFPSFRGDWIALGESEAERRGPACELLAGFEGEAEVGAVLARWLGEDLAAFLGAAEPARALEQRVQAELRALARVDARAAVAELRTALERSLGRSHEIGKVAAAGLGRSLEGRAELARLLRAGVLGGEADRRTRIEACIVLARSAEARAPSEDAPAEVRALACAQLIRDREGAAWELRERMLRALLVARVPAAEAELLRLLLEPALEPVERAALASLLATSEGDGAHVRHALRALVRGAFDLEARRVALHSLAALRDAAGLAELQAEAQRGALAARGEELTILRGELLLALAASGSELDLCAHWLAAPLRQAQADLLGRFEARELAATDFTWRNELALGRWLARAGRAGACLERSAGWERLDARLLSALGEDLLELEPASADALLAAAATALAGERDPDASLRAWIDLRRFELVARAGHGAHAAALAARCLSARRAGELADARWARLLRPGESSAALEARLRAVAASGAPR